MYLHFSAHPAATNHTPSHTFFHHHLTNFSSTAHPPLYSPSLIIQSQPISSHSLIPRTIPPNLVSQQLINQQSNHKLPPTSYHHHSFLLKPTSLTSFFPSLLIYTLLWCKKNRSQSLAPREWSYDILEILTKTHYTRLWKIDM